MMMMMMIIIIIIIIEYNIRYDNKNVYMRAIKHNKPQHKL